MKNFLLVLFLFSVGLISTAHAETGKNKNWCNTSQKIKSPLYLANIGGKIKTVKHKSTDALENPENKIVIIWNYGGGNAQKFNGYCSPAIKNFAGLSGHKIGNKETIFWFNFELTKAGGTGNEPFWKCNDDVWPAEGKIIDQPQDDGNYWKCINAAIPNWNAYKRLQKTVEVVDNFIAAGVPPKQIFVSGVSAGGQDAVLMAVHHADKINAGIPFHPAAWGVAAAGGRRTWYVDQVKSAKRLDILYVNSNSDGTGARHMRPEYMLWMKDIPGVEWLETATYNEKNKVITPDGKKCNNIGKWDKNSITRDADWGYDEALLKIAKKRPDTHDMVMQTCIRYYWPQVLDYITKRVEATQ
jgi:hypothetical protein